MKRHVGAVLIVLTSLLVIDTHVDWVQQDGRGLLEVNGLRLDVRGWAADQVLQWRRRCTAVHTLPTQDPGALAVINAIRQHSLPDSQSARALQLQQWGEWTVADVVFDTLNPSLVVLRLKAGQWQVQDQAVWSGSTAPWHSGDLVRRYLRQQAPDLPSELLSCVTVDSARYGTGPGGLGPRSSIQDAKP
jgi:hypothetical protein